MVSSITQALTGLWHPFSYGRYSFNEIVGHNDVKMILNKAILSKRPCHILLTGKLGAGKTIFLTEMMRRLKKHYFIVGSNTTKAGLVNQLFERQPKFLLIDELDKMSHQDQTSLLHLMETGIISETKVKKTRQLELETWVFATANSVKRIIEPLMSRFFVLEVPEYTFEEFNEIAVSKLGKEKIGKYMATFIARKVWHELSSKDVRDVIKVGRLVQTIADVESVISIMKRPLTRS